MTGLLPLNANSFSFEKLYIYIMILKASLQNFTPKILTIFGIALKKSIFFRLNKKDVPKEERDFFSLFWDQKVLLLAVNRFNELEFKQVKENLVLFNDQLI